MKRANFAIGILLGSCARCAAPQAFADVQRFTCAVPQHVQSLKDLGEFPASIQKLVHDEMGDISPIGGPFDATDAVWHSPPHFKRILFLWRQDDRWLVATERGGIAHFYTTLLFSLSIDGKSVTKLTDRSIEPARVCADAEQQIKQVPAHSPR